MNQEPSETPRIVMPALLRHARTTYGRAMREALADAGYDDIPRNGLYVLGGLNIDAGDVPLGVLIRDLGVSKQAAGQLVDTLVLRGYLDRVADPLDRRKLTVTLTERGRLAAEIQGAARQLIDDKLLVLVGPETVEAARRALIALIDMGGAEEEEAAD